MDRCEKPFASLARALPGVISGIGTAIKVVPACPITPAPVHLQCKCVLLGRVKVKPSRCHYIVVVAPLEIHQSAADSPPADLVAGSCSTRTGTRWRSLMSDLVGVTLSEQICCNCRLVCLTRATRVTPPPRSLALQHHAEQRAVTGGQETQAGFKVN